MKIKIRPGDTSMLQDNDWPQTDGWLAELRDDGRADPARDRRAQPVRGSDPWPEVLAEAAARAEAARAEAARAEAARAEAARAEAARAEAARAEAARAEAARAQADARARAEVAARAESTERAVIGDQLRMPIMWCEMGSCISWHADPAALGEADTRARAIGAGWRIDAFGLAGLSWVPAGRPRLLGHRPGRAVGPVHRRRQGRPGRCAQ